MASKNVLIIKLLKIHIIKISNLNKSFDFSKKQQKYSIDEYLNEILYVLKTGISWRDIRSHINWNSIYKVFIKLNSYNIFKISYVDLLNKYIKKSPNKKLRYISTDTTFIPNKNGQDLKGYNSYYNRKNGTKISLICDSKGFPLEFECYTGNKHDSKILIEQLKEISLMSHHNTIKNKKYFMADGGYDSIKIKEEIRKLGYEPLILQNKRNIKDKTKIIKFNKEERRIYKKRLVIERFFSKLKSCKRLMNRYDSKIESFKGFIYLGLIKMIC